MPGAISADLCVIIDKIMTTTTATKIALGNNGPLVSKLGLGCMRMSAVWNNSANDDDESIATIQQALDSGINFLNTGDFYGSGHNELLVGKAIKGRRDDAFISVKFGGIVYDKKFIGLDLRPIAIKNFINYSLVRLGIPRCIGDHCRTTSQSS
jgi:aryl-alcohol dehydrogenase-like predicted oxidoreductase